MSIQAAGDTESYNSQSWWCISPVCLWLDFKWKMTGNVLSETRGAVHDWLTEDISSEREREIQTACDTDCDKMQFYPKCRLTPSLFPVSANPTNKSPGASSMRHRVTRRHAGRIHPSNILNYLERYKWCQELLAIFEFIQGELPSMYLSAPVINALFENRAAQRQVPSAENELGHIANVFIFLSAACIDKVSAAYIPCLLYKWMDGNGSALGLAPPSHPGLFMAVNHQLPVTFS